MAARFITAVQTLVAREQNPLEPAVGSIHGGTKHNLVPDEVKLQLTARSDPVATRQALRGHRAAGEGGGRRCARSEAAGGVGRGGTRGGDE